MLVQLLNTSLSFFFYVFPPLTAGTYLRPGRRAGLPGDVYPAEFRAGSKRDRRDHDPPTVQQGLPHVPQRAASGGRAGKVAQRNNVVNDGLKRFIREHVWQWFDHCEIFIQSGSP